ncbi:hypothetical protein HPB51_003952 [Rhipicephalus microplus]|uniref:Uncharacterized protein n=1 Tax=Rhipicephalus microplus TaxID=6941 RepID=A0A9J6ERA0_RHIMP|nr:hypothetical protein HPB51_003952 [Rhipicephalus microplus]
MEQAETSLCRIYCRNVKVDEFFVVTESDALAALKKADALFLCPGCGIEPIKTGQCTKFGESYYSHTCSVTTAEGKQCLRCKYTRKLISNQMHRQKQNPKPTIRLRASRQSVQLLRTRRKLAKAQETVEKLRLVNQSVADTAFEQKICGLPPKQQLAVRTCLKAASSVTQIPFIREAIAGLIPRAEVSAPRIAPRKRGQFRSDPFWRASGRRLWPKEQVRAES